MIITLTTDFGLHDSFVGQMKGVILSIAPEVTIVDVTHAIGPQNIAGGAIALETVIDTFPQGTIHVGVIDPGVGSDRPAVAIETDHGMLVGPDNGLFTAALEKSAFRRAVRLTNETYHRKNASRTFHGRDIFAPVAAHLAAGADFAELGEATTELVNLRWPKPQELDDGSVNICILTADRFGNLITNLTRQQFESFRSSKGSANDAAAVYIARKKISTIHETYADVPIGHPVAYFGSGDRLELAIRNGDAATTLKKYSKSDLQLTLRFS